jgi:hypothetical protein
MKVKASFVRYSRSGRPIFTVLVDGEEVLPSCGWPLTWRGARDLEARLRTLMVRPGHSPLEVAQWAAYRWAGYSLHTMADWRRRMKT